MDKPNRAAELNAGIRNTIEQLANETDAARKSQLFRNYLKTSAAFYDYSWHNRYHIVSTDDVTNAMKHLVAATPRNLGANVVQKRAERLVSY